jgi:membrane-associated phospholipid phosphatase
MDQISGMSSEQSLAFSVNSALYPNQVIPPGSVPSWPEPFGAIFPPQTVSGQLPLFANNLLLANTSILADEASRTANPLVTFSNRFLANSSVDSREFNLLTRDNSPVVEIDSVRQNITTSLQQSSQPASLVVDSELAQTIDIAQQQIASFFQQSDVASQLALAFGQGVDAELAKSASLQLPTIEVVPDSLLGTANGAYAASNNTIFLAHSLVARGDQQEIAAVLIEEIGHSIDAHLNSQDSSGDEGEIFAKLVSHHLTQDNYLVLLAENDHSQVLWQGQVLAVENATAENFTIRAAGTVEIKGNSDLDGNPLVLQDDALIYAGKGFSIKGNTILPVKRDINGNPLRDSQGKLILVDRAVAVSAGYSLSETNSQGYGNLTPPQIVAIQQIAVPSYSSLEQQYLTSKIANIPQVTFNANLSNTNNVVQWQQLFPAGGTTTQPRVIRVTGGDLNIPTGVNLSNSIIIVENGDIDLRGSNQQFNNVTLVTKNGDVLLGNVQANNLTVLSAGELFTSDNAKFNGNTLLATKEGDITFKGATSNLNSSQNLQVIAHGEINYSSNQVTRGQFFSSDDFVGNGNITLYGSISSQRSVFLKGNTTIFAVPTATVDVTPPTITVSLGNDTGSNTTDKLTRDAGIKGQVTDSSGIAEFKVQLDGSATAIDLKSKLQADGTFNITDAQVRQLVGNLADGSHSLAFTSKDTAGNQSTFSLSFTLDTAAPLFTLTPLSIIKNDGKLVGQLTDSNLDQLSYQWDSGTAKAISLTSGSFNQALDFTGINNGAHTLTITALDKAGNLTVTPYSVTVAVDKAAPVISAKLAIDSGSNATDGITNSAAITGTVTDDNTIATLQASFDGINFVNVMPGDNGSINLSAAQLTTIKGSALTDGVYNLRFKAQDQFGNVSPLYSVSFTLDTSAATPSQPTLAAVSDSGISATDGITNVKNPQIKGTGEVGSTISLFDGNQQIGQATVGTNETWQITTAPNLTDGQHQLTAQQTDLAGNVSSTSPALDITIDSIAPQLTFTAPGIINNDGKLIGQIVDSNLDQLTYQWDSGTAQAIALTNGNFNQALDFTGIANGAHSLTLTAVDKAGNITVTPYNVTVAVDKAAPLISAKLAIDSGSSITDGITNSAAITGTVTDDSIVATLQASFDGTNFVNILPQRSANGSISISAAQLATIKGSALTDGVYNLRIKAQDQYGNATQVYNISFTLDTTAAAPGQLTLAAVSDSGISNADRLTNVKTPKITGTGEAGSVLTLFDGTQQVGQTNVGIDGNWQVVTATSLTDGQHLLTAQQIDVAGNVSSALPGLVIVIDSTAPQLNLTAPSTIGNDGKLVGQLIDSNLDQLTYQWDNGVAQAVTLTNGNFNQALDFAGISNGAHILTLTATDKAGNITVTLYNITVAKDLVAPIINARLAIDSGNSSTDGITNNATITGTVTDDSAVSSFQASFDGTNFVDILPQLAADGSFSLTKTQLEAIAGRNLNDGNYTLSLNARDKFGNSSFTTTIAFTLNTTIATPTIKLDSASDTGISSTDSITKVNAPKIVGIASPDNQIKLYKGSQLLGETISDKDGNWSIISPVIPDGTHSLFVTATNLAGVTSNPSKSLLLTIDTTAPITPDFRNTVSSINKGKIDLTGNAEISTIITLNNSTTITTVDRNGNFYFDNVGLTLGSNIFTISSTDLAGNITISQPINIERIASNPDLVLKWNNILLAAITSDQTPPPAAARRLAMLHAAIFDAVNAVSHTYDAYRVDLTASGGTSAEAAVAAVAHRILTELYPQQRAIFDAALNIDLATIPDNQGETDGVRLGQEVADAMLAWRRNDGAETIEDEYIAGTTAGKWQPTAAGGFAVLPEWGEVAPFALDNSSQFRPVAPPDLTSETYTNDFNQVKELGKVDSSTRTAEQTQIARFWADGVGTYTPSGHWNKIAEEVALNEGNTLIENARLFAALNVSLADAGIAAWDAKYTYEFWRPITAIQQANTDNNPNTLADATWRPLIPTPLFPEYVSGHSTFSGAAATVLTSAFGNNYQFNTDTVNPSLTGVSRHFSSFQAAAGEASDSRIYGGIHFKTAGKEGLKLGDNIANYVLANNFRKSTQSARISLSLANDTGDTRDRITSIPVIAANLNSLPAGSFQVLGGFGDNFLAYTDLSADVGNDGKLLLDTARLSVVNGGILADGKYTFNLRIVDSNKNILQTGSLSFTLDRSAPILNLNNLVDGANLVVGSALNGTIDGTGSNMVSLSYQFDNGAIETISLEQEFTQIDRRLPIENLSAGAHILSVMGRDIAGNVTTESYQVNTNPALPFQLVGYNPINGALEVGSTFRPQIFFSHSVDVSTLTTDSLYATFNGVKLAARIVPSTDGKWAWLYFQNPLPSSARIQVTVDGNLIRATSGNSLLDADVDGTPGGKTTFSFDTVSRTLVPGTRLTGIVADPGADRQANTLDDRLPGADGQLHTDDDIYRNPLAGVKVTILGMEDFPVYTDANGRFTFESAPIGDVKLAVDGRTATGISPTLYFPEMVLDVSVEPGVTNYAMTNMPEIYLPRISRDIFADVSSTGTTIINATAAGTPELTPEQRQYLRLEVDGGSAIGEDGLPVNNVRVGVATVPPDLVRDMLPPGVLQHTFDITIQANGVANFATPAKITVPNVFGAPPGTKLNILSFDHTTGRLVIDGTATVSADGLYVTSDLGSGITRPGWHGVTPPGGCGNGSPPPTPPANNNITVTQLAPEALSIITSESATISLPTWTAPPGPAPTPLPPGCAGPPSPPSNAPKREIEIEVEGPLKDFMEKTGDVDLVKQTIILQQGIRNSATFSAKARNYQAMFNGVDKLLRDRLYGSRIKVSDTLTNADGSRTKTVKSYYLYRWVDALDAQAALAKSGNTAIFARTFVDGTGSFTRTKNIDIRQGLDMKTNFTGTSNEFRYGQLFKGVDRAQWVFDPISAGSKTDTITIQADDTINIGQLTAKGTATAPTTVNINLSGYQAELGRVLQAMVRNVGNDGNLNTADDVFTYTLAGGTTQTASSRFTSQFAGFLPGNNFTTAQLNAKLQQEGQALAAAVAADYNPINLPNRLPGYQFVSSGGDVTMNWFDVVFNNSDVFGSANFDSDTTTLGTLLLTSTLVSQSAKQIALSEAINQRVSDSGQFGVGINIDWTSTATFAQYVANTVSHEIGHPFGLLDAYWGPNSTPTPPNDIMRSGNRNDGDLTFAPSHRQLLAAALGMQNNGDLPITAGLNIYRLNFNNPTSNIGLPRDLNYSTAPEIILSDLNAELLNGDRLDFDPIAVDSSDGLQQVKTISITNAGFDTLNLTSLELANSNSGFSVLNLANIPTSLAVGASTQIQVAFDPTVIGTNSDRLIIQSNASQDSTLRINLSGEGISLNPWAEFQLGNNNLGGVLSNNSNSVDKIIGTLTNRGAKPLEITDIRIVDGSDAFTLIGIPNDISTKPIQIDRGNSFEIPSVRFATNRLGLVRGAIELTTNDPKAGKIRIGVVGTGVATTIYPEWGQDYIAVETPNLTNSPVLRTKSDNRGNFQLFLPPEQFYQFSAFDPVTGLIGKANGLTPQSGGNINLSGGAVFAASTAADRDYDGLPDDIELAVGSNPNRPDTNRDGIDDFTALQRGIEVIGKNALPLGIVSSIAPLDSGYVRDVVAKQDTAYLAAGSGGFQIVDLTQVKQPTIVSSIPSSILGGEAIALATGSVNASTELTAIVTNNGKLAIVNVTDRDRPVVEAKLDLGGNGTSIDIVDRFAYIGFSDGQIKVVDLERHQSIAQFNASGGTNLPIKNVIARGDILYILNSGSFAAYDIRANFISPPLLSQVNLSGASVSVADNRAYITTSGFGGGGFITLDISNPKQILALPTTSNVNPIAKGAIADNGSGNVLVAGTSNFGSLGDLQLQLFNNSNGNFSFIREFNTPGTVSDIWIQDGLALIADGNGGLSIFNYLEPDIANVAPTISILPQGVINNNITEGLRTRIDIRAFDDVQVRNVSLNVNGQNFTPDGSAPFSFYVTVPSLSSGVNKLQLQAIATDMGGNTITSNINLNIVADTTGPQIIAISPGGTSVPQVRDIRIIFDESVTLDNSNAIRLVEAGIDRVFNTTDDRLIPIENIRNINNFNTLDIQSSSAGIGRYQLQIDQTSIRNVSGIPLGTGIETFNITATGLYQLPAGNLTTLTSGDLNNDSFNDLLVNNIGGTGVISLITNQYGAIVSQQNSLNEVPVKSATLGDINKDGNLDAILVLSGGGYGSNDLIGVSLGNGDGTFADTPTIITIPNQDPDAFKLGDFNGDAYTDIVTYRTGSNQISLLSGSSTGFTFQSNLDIGIPINSLAVGDINNDGKLDLIVSNNNPDLQIWLNQGNNTFTPGTSLITGNNPGKVVVADFDRDGFLDIAAVSNIFGGGYTTGVSLWYGSNNGIFGSRTNYATNSYTTDLAIGDFNNDGYLDLATANSYTFTFSILNNQRNRDFAPSVNYYSQGAIQRLQLIDWNHDGRVDIVTVNESNNIVTPYLGNGNGTINATIAPPFVDMQFSYET